MDNLQVAQNLRNEIKQLKADRLEMARAIVENCEYEYICPEYGSLYMFCKYCEEDIDKHDRDCIVIKAEKIIEESK